MRFSAAPVARCSSFPPSHRASEKASHGVMEEMSYNELQERLKIVKAIAGRKRYWAFNMQLVLILVGLSPSYRVLVFVPPLFC